MTNAILARLQGIWCFLRGHDLEWAADPDPGPPIYCAGDIVCHTCNLVHWCRGCDPWNPQ